MTILITLAILIAIGIAYKKQSDKRKDSNKESVPVESALKLNRSRYIYIDDIIRGILNSDNTNISGSFSGDANGTQDLACAFGLMIHYNSIPLAIGVTSTRSGRDMDLTQLMVNASGLDIPAIYGASNNHMMTSDLANFITTESHKGKLDIVVGGTVTDVAKAITMGANQSNLRVIGTVYGTSNEIGDQESADILNKSAVKVINIGDPEYKTLLLSMPKTTSINERAFIDKWRSLKFWDMAFTSENMAKASAENAYQFGHNLPFRISDCMNLDRLLSGNPETYKGYLDYAGIMARIENGLNMASKLKPKEIFKPVRAPILANSFNPAKVNTLGYTNPLPFPITSNISKSDMRIDRANVRHSKEGVWTNKQFSGGYVNSNLWLVYNNGVEWCLLPYEYLRPNDGAKNKGYGVINADIRRGDQIGVMVSTIVRRGDLANGKERSNISWITV